jgi:hypothetical protein
LAELEEAIIIDLDIFLYLSTKAIILINDNYYSRSTTIIIPEIFHKQFVSDIPWGTPGDVIGI